MDGIHKIRMYNICAADVIFRIEGKLYNEGWIVADRDSFEFIGHMADDIIIGRYDWEGYKITYYYNEYGGTVLKKIILNVKINLTDITELIKKVFKSTNGVALAFKDIECKDKDIIHKAINSNKDLIVIET